MEAAAHARAIGLGEFAPFQSPGEQGFDALHRAEQGRRGSVAENDFTPRERGDVGDPAAHRPRADDGDLHAATAATVRRATSG